MDRGEVFSRGLIRKIVPVLLFGIALSAGLFLFADVRTMSSHLRHVSGEWVLVALAMVLGNFTLRALRWHYYLVLIRSGIGFFEGLPVFLIGFAAGVTPGKIGEVVKSLLLKEKWETPIAHSAPIVAVERISDLVGVLLLGGFGLLAIHRLIVFALAALLAALAIMFLCGVRSLGEWIVRVVRKIPVLEARGEKISAAHGSFLVVVGWAPMLVATVLSVAAWGCLSLCLWATAQAFPGTHIGLGAALVSTCMPLLAGALALVPGGLGATEASMAGILMLVGGRAMGRSLAVAITMLFRILSFWFAVGIGLVTMLAWRRAPRRSLATTEPPQ